MTELLAKFIDLLKASGWQTAMIAAGTALFIYLSHDGVLPALEPPLIELVAWAVLFVSAALAAASLISAVQQVLRHGWKQLQLHRAIRNRRNTFIKNIPFLSEDERRILGYLREKKQKTFTADHDGGYANTLIAKRYVGYIGAPGQSFDFDKVPMAVADYVWDIIQERPADLPYAPVYRENGRRYEVQPWRIHWMAR